MPKNTATNHFPTKLHEMLDDAESKGHSHIISWCPDGRSFRIHDPQGMVPILADYFRQTKYKSLLRQLQGYDFKRVTSGENKGNVSHHMFLRGKRHLCIQMKRKQTAAKASKLNLSSKTSQDKKFAETTSTSTTSQNQPDTVSSNGAKSEQPKTQTNGINLKQLESNFRSSMKHALSQPENNHHVSKVYSAPPLVGGNATGHQHRRATGMDALRVEIGCTFSSSRDTSSHMKSASSSSSFKRRAPQQPYPVQSSASAPEFETGRLSKRQRSGGQQLGHLYHSNDASSTYKNASFSFSATRGSQQAREEAIITEEKMQFQKSQQEKQKRQEFDQLEKLCFSNFPQGPGAQQFQHSHRSTSALGTLDLDISLTTTTTTTHRNGSDPHVSSSTVCNKLVLPSQLEPTPILSPKRGPRPSSTRICDGFTLSCDIDFSSQLDNKDNQNMDIVLKLPSGTMPQDQSFPECSSIGGDASLGRASEVSDEIDEGIAEAFGENEKGKQWTFDSDCEDDEEDDWTKGITYHGKTDCVLEPEKFQIEEQGLLSGTQYEELSRSQEERGPREPHCVQQPQHEVMMYQQQNFKQLPRPMQMAQQPLVGVHQTQCLPFHNPYALLSKPMPFQQQNFPTRIQIQQIKR